MFKLTGRIEPPACLRNGREDWRTIGHFPSLEEAQMHAENASGLPVQWQEVNGGLESPVVVHNMFADFDRARIVET